MGVEEGRKRTERTERVRVGVNPDIRYSAPGTTTTAYFTLGTLPKVDTIVHNPPALLTYPTFTSRQPSKPKPNATPHPRSRAGDRRTWAARLEQAANKHCKVPVQYLSHLLGFSKQQARVCAQAIGSSLTGVSESSHSTYIRRLLFHSHSSLK